MAVTFQPFRCLSGVTDYDKQELFYMIRTQLGEPIVKVELDDANLETAFCLAIREYSHFINQWALENRLSQFLGLPREIDFTLKYVSNNFSLEKSFAKSISEQAGLSMESTRELKTDSIILTAGTQDYYIQAGREINEILWFTPSFINLFGLDAFANSNLSYTEFGASFAGHSLYYVMPLFDTLLTSQAAELRNKVRASEYSYRVTGGPNGTKRLSLYPVPRTPTDNHGLVGASTPGTVFYRYYDKYGVAGNSELSGYTANPGFTGGTWSQGNGLVSGPSDAQLNTLVFNELNSSSKFWVQKYATAIATRILGLSIRGKFSGELPIPDATVTLNSADLIAAADNDMAKLKEELREELDRLNYKALLENNAMMQENINKALSYIPLGIYLG